MRYVLDIETNGLYYDVTAVHVLVMYEVDKKETHVFTSALGNIKKGIQLLEKAEEIIGHNIIFYDLPVLQKLYGLKWETKKVYDTLIVSQLAVPEIIVRDMNNPKVPPKYKGRYSLKAWGFRLGELKDDFGDTTDWSSYSDEMRDYCVQDVKVTVALFNYLSKKEVAEEAMWVEHNFARIISRQERYGWKFDVPSAQKLHIELLKRKEELEAALVGKFKYIVKRGTEFEPKVGNKSTGVIKGAPYCKVVFEPFNPQSRAHIITSFKNKYGWKPKEFTEGGSALINEKMLKSLPFEEAPILIELLTISKLLGQLAEGNNAWLKLVKKDGRMHGQVNTLGAVTGRCTHSYPNMAQVPSSRAFKGHECRSLFVADKGKVIVGCDASGLELRTLSHYLAKYDGGAYGQTVLSGDIHTANQLAAGLATRDQSKTFIYAFLYGAGDEKIGSIIGKGRKEGAEIKQRFFTKIPAIKKLSEGVASAVKKRGYLMGLDGRRYFVRSEHAALNVLLQGAGAIVMKYYLILLDANLQKMVPGKYEFVGNIHDEVQIEVDEDVAKTVAAEAVRTFEDVTERLQFRIKLEGESKIGSSWAETH